MKATLLLALAGLLISLLGVPAQADASRSWTSPDGVFSVAIPDGWATVSDASADQRRVLTIGSPTQQAGVALRQCSIDRLRRTGLVHRDQNELNQIAADWTASRVQDGPGVLVHSFSNDVIDGVRVIAFDKNLGSFRNQQKIFDLATETGFTQYTLSCGASLGRDMDTDIEAMTAFMASLTFLR